MSDSRYAPTAALVLPGCSALALGAALSTLQAVADLLDQPYLLAPRVVSLRGGAMTGSAGLRVETEPLRVESPWGLMVLVGQEAHIDIGFDGAGLAPSDSGPMIDALRSLASQGCTLCASGSAVSLLAQAGLLDGLRAACPWSSAEALQAEYPQVLWTTQLWTSATAHIAAAGTHVGAMGSQVGASGIHAGSAGIHAGSAAPHGGSAGTHAGAAVSHVSSPAAPGTLVLTATSGTALIDALLAWIGERHGDHLLPDLAPLLGLERGRPGDESQPRPNRLSQTASPKLREALALMEANLGEPLPTEDVARLCGVSRRQLERLFKRHLDTLPSRHYLELRLQRARRLLLQSGQSILQVGLSCGFSSGPHFSNAYKARFGRTPREERSPGGPTEASARDPGEGS
ncbi:GlxA family transcriptional regulator [Roseateles depolymerans]|uniref:Transcriptional regulator AraC family n=1 Tax=Roseateles depolymerans TaxID=76731 RepID=A0A0U3MEU4_9BURK|nr:helix-turn-helix domain-containing protein [Roseateles depolymerans]ALV06044.1 Transcriptional regulator AraC family [Roseateles depolymerans]REG11980.1 helix-turn-helix protein [Roseateles depolymerans]